MTRTLYYLQGSSLSILIHFGDEVLTNVMSISPMAP